MRHTMVTYTVKLGPEEENIALVRAVFDELRGPSSTSRLACSRC
jgi:hypothetical protein